MLYDQYVVINLPNSVCERPSGKSPPYLVQVMLGSLKPEDGHSSIISWLLVTCKEGEL